MRDWTDQLLRSLLFVPGSDQEKLGKVARFGGDAIVVDLEDAVAAEEKIGARQTTRAAIAPLAASDSAVVVRVNGIDTGLLDGDVDAVVAPGLDAVMVPKVETPETLAHLDAQLSAAEGRAGLEAGEIRVIVLIETSRGLTRCEEILATAPDRVHVAAFGAGDFSVELGIDLTPEAAELQYARSRLVVASRAAGLVAPIDGPWLHLEDYAGLEADCRRSRGLGFQGRVVVYPPQVDTVHAAYSALEEADAARQRRIVEAFEEAEKRGVASLRVEGRFVDYPIYRMALDRIRRYDAWVERTEVTP